MALNKCLKNSRALQIISGVNFKEFIVMKFRIGCISIICIIVVLILSSRAIENDAVHEIVNNNMDIQTNYDDNLHFDISSYANLHHQFIKYGISLSNVTEVENNFVSIVLRDQNETVYDNPLSVFSEIASENNISLYKLENNYIFIYDDHIATYPTDDNIFKDYSEIDVIKRFEEAVLNN